jgi:hypothetical protein
LLVKTPGRRIRLASISTLSQSNATLTLSKLHHRKNPMRALIKYQYTGAINGILVTCQEEKLLTWTQTRMMSVATTPVFVMTMMSSTMTPAFMMTMTRGAMTTE